MRISWKFINLLNKTSYLKRFANLLRLLSNITTGNRLNRSTKRSFLKLSIVTCGNLNLLKPVVSVSLLLGKEKAPLLFTSLVTSGLYSVLQLDSEQHVNHSNMWGWQASLVCKSQRHPDLCSIKKTAVNSAKLCLCRRGFWSSDQWVWLHSKSLP